MAERSRRTGFVASVVVVVFTLLVVGASPAAAFDGHRRGFVLGVGAGNGRLSLPGYSDFDGKTGLFTDLKLGVGVDDRTVVHYSGRGFWGDPVIAYPMLALTHFVKADGPGPFASVGAGAGVHLVSLGGGDANSGGPALGGSLGYEFARHWCVEVSVISTFQAEGSTNMTTIMGTIGGLAY